MSRPELDSTCAGLVSTVDDYAAFAGMMLGGGAHGGGRILSRPSIETMTADHLTPAQKAVSGLLPGCFDSHGRGFGVAAVTRREDVARSVGSHGWDGGLGTSWTADPAGPCASTAGRRPTRRSTMRERAARGQRPGSGAGAVRGAIAPRPGARHHRSGSRRSV